MSLCKLLINCQKGGDKYSHLQVDTSDWLVQSGISSVTGFSVVQTTHSLVKYPAVEAFRKGIVFVLRSILTLQQDFIKL